MNIALVTRDEEYAKQFKDRVNHDVSVFNSCKGVSGFDILFAEPNFDYHSRLNSKKIILINGDIRKLENLVEDRRVWAILRKQDFEEINKQINKLIGRSKREVEFNSLVEGLESSNAGLRSGKE